MLKLEESDVILFSTVISKPPGGEQLPSEGSQQGQARGTGESQNPSED